MFVAALFMSKHEKKEKPEQTNRCPLHECFANRERRCNIYHFEQCGNLNEEFVTMVKQHRIKAHKVVWLHDGSISIQSLVNFISLCLSEMNTVVVDVCVCNRNSIHIIIFQLKRVVAANQITEFRSIVRLVKMSDLNECLHSVLMLISPKVSKELQCSRTLRQSRIAQGSGRQSSVSGAREEE